MSAFQVITPRSSISSTPAFDRGFEFPLQPTAQFSELSPPSQIATLKFEDGNMTSKSERRAIVAQNGLIWRIRGVDQILDAFFIPDSQSIIARVSYPTPFTYSLQQPPPETRVVRLDSKNTKRFYRPRVLRGSESNQDDSALLPVEDHIFAGVVKDRVIIFDARTLQEINTLDRGYTLRVDPVCIQLGGSEATRGWALRKVPLSGIPEMTLFNAQGLKLLHVQSDLLQRRIGSAISPDGTTWMFSVGDTYSGVVVTREWSMRPVANYRGSHHDHSAHVTGDGKMFWQDIRGNLHVSNPDGSTAVVKLPPFDDFPEASQWRVRAVRPFADSLLVAFGNEIDSHQRVSRWVRIDPDTLSVSDYLPIDEWLNAALLKFQNGDHLVCVKRRGSDQRFLYVVDQHGQPSVVESIAPKNEDLPEASKAVLGVGNCLVLFNARYFDSPLWENHPSWRRDDRWYVVDLKIGSMPSLVDHRAFVKALPLNHGKVLVVQEAPYTTNRYKLRYNLSLIEDFGVHQIRFSSSVLHIATAPTWQHVYWLKYEARNRQISLFRMNVASGHVEVHRSEDRVSIKDFKVWPNEEMIATIPVNARSGKRPVIRFLDLV